MDIGVDFGRMTTLRNLKRGAREAGLDDELGEEVQTSSGGKRRQR